MADIIDFKKAKEEKEEKDLTGEGKEVIDKTTEEILANIQKKNEEDKEKRKKERLDANKSVLRSYRIKPKKPTN